MLMKEKTVDYWKAIKEMAKKASIKSDKILKSKNKLFLWQKKRRNFVLS